MLDLERFKKKKKKKSQRSTLLMKHCREAGPVALSKPWSALWAHTPTVHPPPPSAYQGENSQGRKSEPRESKIVRMREREEQEVTDLYPPLLRFHALVNQSSTFWLLLWYGTAGRWVKTATSALRGKTSQILCLHTEPLALALHSRTESERKVSLVSYSCRTQRWPALTTHQDPVYCSTVPNWTPAM